MEISNDMEIFLPSHSIPTIELYLEDISRETTTGKSRTEDIPELSQENETVRRLLHGEVSSEHETRSRITYVSQLLEARTTLGLPVDPNVVQKLAEAYLESDETARTIANLALAASVDFDTALNPTQ